PYARISGEIITSQLAEIGIKLDIVPMEWAQWLEQVFTNKDFDLTIIAHTEPNDIDIYGREGYYFGYNNPEFKAVMAELDQSSDPAVRNELYRKAEHMIADDEVNGFLLQLPKIGVWDAKLTGLWDDSPLQANDLTKVRWTD